MAKNIGYKKLREHMDIFELLLPKYHLPTKPRLFEAFAGIGCQRMALDKLGVDYKVVGISEIDKYALASYQAMHNECPNLGSITDIKGKDMPITDIFTYSFPCTDLSKAGQQKGLNKDTRSGLIFEVLRLLHEMKEHNKLPQVLIMENVVDLIQVKFIEQWKEIQYEIEQMGYTNYTFTMNAKNYGVAQNRDRVFMVSILGQYYYETPQPIPLEKRLKDYLEPNVDEKYYLSDQFLKYLQTDHPKHKRSDKFAKNVRDGENDNANTITTREGNVIDSTYIKTPLTVKGFTEQQAKMITLDGNVKRYIHSEVVDEFNAGDSADISFPNGYDKGKRTFKGIAPALNLTTTESSLITKLDDLRIRKLTPKECWRLMGIDDSYFDKASKVVSKSQLYKQAGNGIVVDVFAHIIKNMLGEEQPSYGNRCID